MEAMAQIRRAYLRHRKSILIILNVDIPCLNLGYSEVHGPVRVTVSFRTLRFVTGTFWCGGA